MLDTRRSVHATVHVIVHATDGRGRQTTEDRRRPAGKHPHLSQLATYSSFDHRIDWPAEGHDLNVCVNSWNIVEVSLEG